MVVEAFFSAAVGGMTHLFSAKMAAMAEFFKKIMAVWQNLGQNNGGMAKFRAK